ncbi:MAG: AAA family ATPase [Candidatus Micrarchaeia archaeon]
MIEFIELRNWKTHEDTKLSFAKGTSVLIGQMGSGKSSVMDAISYALFGTFPSLQRRKINTVDLIKNIPDQKEFAEVLLGLSVGGSTYLIERRIERVGSATAKISKEGKIIQTQPQRVNEFVEGLLRLDYDLFSRAIYSEQNNLDYFLDLRSGERKDTIDELLGLDKFALAEDNATSLIHKIDDLAEQQESAAGSFDRAKLEEQINDEKNKLSGLKKEAETLNEKQVALNEKIKSLSAEYKRIQEKNYRKINLEKELESNEARVGFVEREAKKIEEMNISKADLESKITELSKNIAKNIEEEKVFESKERESNRFSATLESEIKKMEEDKAERDRIMKSIGDKKIDAYKQKYENTEKEIENYEKVLAAAMAKKEEIEKYIGDLSQHISKCPVCERELDNTLRLRLLEEKKNAIESAEREISNLSKNVTDARKLAKSLSNELNALMLADERLKKYSGLEEKLAKATEELKKVNAIVASAKENTCKIRKEIESSTKELARLESIRRELDKLEAYKKELDELREKVQKSRAELERLKKEVSEDLLDAKQKEFTSASSELSAVAARLSNTLQSINEKEKELSEKVDILKHVDDLLKDAENKKKTAEELKKYKNALSETQGFLRSKLINSINEIMSEIWPELYPYGDYIDIRLNASKEDYVLEVKILKNNTEEWKPVENIASGGERSIACLAMRVAFALVLVPNLKWLILDEPTHNIDEQGITKFVRVFNETLPRIVEQVFLITHDEVLKQASSSKTYLLSRDKASHGSTVVEEI